MGNPLKEKKIGSPASFKTSAVFLPSHFHLSFICECRLGTTGDFKTSFLHFSLFSTGLWDSANSRPVHSLMLSSHLSLCFPCLLPPFPVPCKMVMARPDEQETCLYHCGLHLFLMVRRSLVVHLPAGSWQMNCMKTSSPYDFSGWPSKRASLHCICIYRLRDIFINV